ncbi:restriction endonuclease subunit S [Bathymodiolus azoricus thioautotrophic gill symbiont]|nr:restriction endonuclease subunit S [Bathymodiolus azoricus thioautotrophic gill symbiont]
MENGELSVESGGSAWREVNLANAPVEILDGDRGKNYPKKNEFSDNGYCLFLNTKNVTSSGFNFSELNFITEEKDCLLRKGKLERNDIVLTTRGTVGNVAFYNEGVDFENIRVNSGMVIIRPAGLHPVFNYQLFKFLTLDLSEFISGSAQPQLPIRDLKQVIFKLPPLPEQKAIADVLSALDDKIDLLHCQNKTLEQMAETLFRQWFVVEAGEDWVEKPLSSVANFLNGLACQKFPPKNEVDKFPVLKIKQLRNGFSDECDWCTTEVKAEYIIENGDVIFSWSASLMVKIWDGDQCILNQHLFKVTSDDFPKWYYYLWSKHHLAEFVSISSSHATTMGHIKRGDLDDAMVLVPSPEESEEFSEIFTPLLDKIISNNKRLKNLTSLRDTLLPKLMSGEVRIASNG